MPSAAQIERWRHARAANAQLHWVRFQPAFALGILAVVDGVLWRAGYPVWRLATIAGIFAGLIALAIWSAHEARGVQATGNCGSRMCASLRGSIILSLFAMSITGGLRSPLIPLALGMLADIVMQHGWGTVARRTLGLISASALAMALLPASWLGPPLPQPAFWLISGVLMAVAGAVFTWRAVLQTRSLEASDCELMRVREEMAGRAWARARELEQLGARLSHELKNPLAAIKGLVQLAARRACDPESLEQLRVVEGEVERMRAILQEYLSFSRPFEELRPEPLSLGELSEEVLSVLEARAAAEGIQLRRRGDARIEADPRRLREALFNLVANAIEATPRGGKVEVEIAERDGAADVSVRDSGRGMPREVLDRIGTAFFTTRAQGTGLGVVLARAAFSQHGGSLRYESAPERGTVVTGTLPLRRSDVASLAG